MRRILICTGILGGGTALTFAVAALAAAILPGGTVVQANPVVMERNFAKPGIDIPMPAPIAPDVIIDDAGGQTWVGGAAFPDDGGAPAQP
jgi:hypothetical protein